MEQTAKIAARFIAEFVWLDMCPDRKPHRVHTHFSQAMTLLRQLWRMPELHDDPATADVIILVCPLCECPNCDDWESFRVAERTLREQGYLGTIIAVKMSHEEGGLVRVLKSGAPKTGDRGFLKWKSVDDLLRLAYEAVPITR